MRYLLKRLVSFRSSLTIFCALLSLDSIIVLSEYNNGNNNIIISQLLSQKSKLIQVAVAISNTPSDFRGTATVSNVQFPGIIPSINNSIPASPLISRPPPPIIRNTRAPTAPGGPTLNTQD